jgi:hypothetical protein
MLASLLGAQVAAAAAPVADVPVDLLFATGLMFLGVVVHFVVVMAGLEDAGERYTPLGYLRLHPWRAVSMVLSAWLLLWMCHELGELTRVTAVLIGFSCQSAADRLRTAAISRTNK